MVGGPRDETGARPRGGGGGGGARSSLLFSIFTRELRFACIFHHFYYPGLVSV